MSTPRTVADARAALARQLASLRQASGLSQAHAAKRLGYSRSAVARAEATGICSRDFCQLAGQLYQVGDRLALAHDRIQAHADAARSQAARQARQRRHPAVPEPSAHEGATTVTDLDAACPYCAKPMTVLVRQTAALLPMDTPPPPPQPDRKAGQP
jgi:transcriptional regulator with XRE-family HTH domain